MPQTNTVDDLGQFDEKPVATLGVAPRARRFQRPRDSCELGEAGLLSVLHQRTCEQGNLIEVLLALRILQVIDALAQTDDELIDDFAHGGIVPTTRKDRL